MKRKPPEALFLSPQEMKDLGQHPDIPGRLALERIAKIVNYSLYLAVHARNGRKRTIRTRDVCDLLRARNEELPWEMVRPALICLLATPPGPILSRKSGPLLDRDQHLLRVKKHAAAGHCVYHLPADYVTQVDIERILDALEPPGVPVIGRKARESA
jgi:hypothetical protein